MNHATRQATLRTDLLDANLSVSMGTEPDFPKGRTDVGVLAASEVEERTQRMDEDLLQAIREDAHLQRQIQNAPPGVDLSSLLAEPLRGASVDGDWGIEGWGESDENARLSSELDRLLQSSLFPNDHSTQFRSKAAEEGLPSAQWLRKSTPLLHGRPPRPSTGGAASKGVVASEEPPARKEPRGGAREEWSKVPSTTEMSRQIALDALRQRPDSAQPKPKATQTTGESLAASKGVESRVRVAEALGDPSLLVEEVRLSSQPSEDDTSQFSPNEIHAILSLAPEEDDEAEVFQSPPPGKKVSASLHEDVTRDVTRSARQALGHASVRERFKEADETTRRVSLQARKREKGRGGSGELGEEAKAKAPAPVAPAGVGEARGLLRAPQARPEGRVEAVGAPVGEAPMVVGAPVVVSRPVAVAPSLATTGEVRAVARGQASSMMGELGLRALEAPTTAKLYRAPQVAEAAVVAGEQTAARVPVALVWRWQRLLGVAVGVAMILSSSVPLAQVSGAWPWSPVIALIPIICGAVFILSHALGVVQLFQRMVFVVFGGLFLAFCATPGFFHLLGAFQAWGAGVPQLALVLLLVGAAPREASPSSGSH